MDLPGFEKALESAWQKRSALRKRTDAYRLLNGAASGTPGLIVDVFAGYLAVYAYDKDTAERYGDFASRLAEVTGAKGISLKDRSAKGEEGREEGRDLYGTVPESADVREGPLKFRIHPRHPRNVGLFLDTRLLRETLTASCPDHDVLNLFSYSCSLGIAAAHGNRASVVNVDVSARYLGWGRENLALNGLPAERMKFVRMDSGKYLDWAAKKSLAYDVIILDPPSFSRSEAGTFSFANDYWRLLEKCARLLRPQGRIYSLTNFGGISPERFRRNLDETFLAAGREGAGIRRLPLPEDFDGAGDPESASGPGRGAGSTVEGTLLAFESVLA
ncbi:MAG: SAM-dependent methyltransferase [Fibrobacteres bacterium]|nr:SAM-dependent methyltransferase [Fibrobacterota bacterium]